MNYLPTYLNSSSNTWKAKQIFLKGRKCLFRNSLKTPNSVLLTQHTAFEMVAEADRAYDFQPHGTLSNLVLLGVSVIL